MRRIERDHPGRSERIFQSKFPGEPSPQVMTHEVGPFRANLVEEVGEISGNQIFFIAILIAILVFSGSTLIETGKIECNDSIRFRKLANLVTPTVPIICESMDHQNERSVISRAYVKDLGSVRGEFSALEVLALIRRLFRRLKALWYIEIIEKSSRAGEARSDEARHKG
jgi:hypothetical protein